jgi:hypothetical protein
MAGFRTHVTTSSVLGVAYGAGAWYLYDVPAPTCVLACGLCGVSGMLPDLDSGPGVPLRESQICFASGCGSNERAVHAERLEHVLLDVVLEGLPRYDLHQVGERVLVDCPATCLGDAEPIE